MNEIVDIKRKKYQLRGTYKETFYNHIITFFKNEIVKLWPDGWMGINVILKHCKTLNQNRTESKSTNSSSVVIKSKTNSIGKLKKKLCYNIVNFGYENAFFSSKYQYRYAQ